MALLRCDKCGSNDTNAFGSWDTPIKILCKKCSNKQNDKMKTFEKYRFTNSRTGRMIYEMLLNSELSSDELHKRLTNKKQELANKHRVNYGDIFWKYIETV